MEYKKNISKAFVILKNYPVLFLPDLIFYILFSFSVYFFYKYSGLAGFLGSTILNTGTNIQLFQTFLTTNFAQIIISVIIFFLITFVIGVSIYAIKYSLIKQILEKKLVSFKRELFLSQKYIYKIILIKICIYILGILAIFIITVLSALFYVSLNTLQPELANPFTAAFAGILIVVALLLIKLGFLLRYPILFLEKDKSIIEVLKKAFTLFYKKPVSIFLIWLTIIIVTFAFNFGQAIIDLIIYSINVQNITIQTTLAILVVLLGIAIKLIQILWADVYLFLVYNSNGKS
ncbi:MAG: hypothetical protein ABIF40_05650 [archaeon]